MIWLMWQKREVSFCKPVWYANWRTCHSNRYPWNSPEADKGALVAISSVLTAPARAPSRCWSRRPGGGRRGENNGPRHPVPRPREALPLWAPARVAASSGTWRPTAYHWISRGIFWPLRIYPWKEKHHTSISISRARQQTERSKNIVVKVFAYPEGILHGLFVHTNPF